MDGFTLTVTFLSAGFGRKRGFLLGMSSCLPPCPQLDYFLIEVEKEAM
jgi:hypothetical protein